MNDSRERFGLWLSDFVNKHGYPPDIDEAWQAAEQQALDRAAQQAEEKAGDCHTLGNAEEFRELEACIRALIEQSASKEKR